MVHRPPFLLLLAGALALAAAVGAACTTSADCSSSGSCSGGVCSCRPGFTGPTCALVDFGPSYQCGDGGLCLDGQSTWGGSVIEGPAGRFHMFGALMDLNCTLGAWLTHSVVLHSVANTSAGPYVASDIALGRRGSQFWDDATEHNPVIGRAPDGTYLLYYMGTNGSNTPKPCAADGRGGSPLRDGGAPEWDQRIGLATSKSLDGPWLRRDHPVLSPGPAGAWDDGFTTNPAVHVFANGTILMVYKARSKKNPREMAHGIAVAKDYNSPFVRMTPTTPLSLPGTCEDPGLFRDTAGVFQLVLHCGCAYKRAWSEDGISWTILNTTVGWCNLKDPEGTNFIVTQRERPMWLLDSKGNPTRMFNGAKPEATQHGGRTFTLATDINP